MNRGCLDNFILKLEVKDAYFNAEYSLLDFTERVCEIHGQYKGIYLIYYRIFEWLADKLLWRNATNPIESHPPTAETPDAP